MRKPDNSVGNTEAVCMADSKRVAGNTGVDNIVVAGHTADKHKNHPEHGHQPTPLAVLKVIFSFRSLFNERVVAMNLS